MNAGMHGRVFNLLKETNLDRKSILWLGGLAILGGCLSVLADVYSAYLPSMSMATATSVSLESVANILGAKSHSDHLVGSTLGQFFIPFHIFGWILLYFALSPAHIALRALILVFTVYITIIGTSLHASLVYAGAIIRSRDQFALVQVGEFFDLTAYTLVAGVLVFGAVVALLIVTGRTLFPKWIVLISPLGYLVITTSMVAALPASYQSVSAFVTATGFNLPSTLLHIASTVVLYRRLGEALPVPQDR